MSTSTVRVIALQPSLRWMSASGGMQNMHLIRQTLEKHVLAAPADIIVLPEVFNGINCEDDPAAAAMARRFLSTLARACRAAVVGGIDCDQGGTRRNLAFVMDAEGNEIGAYAKRVLFGRELGARVAGTEPGVFAVAGIRVGVLICGDMWQAETVAELRGRADLLCVCTKTTVQDQAHVEYARRLWWNLALTRAMENAVPIVVSDWAEDRHESFAVVEGTRVRSVHYTSGGSSITDPGRRPDFAALQANLPHGEPGLLAAAIDLDAVARFRDYRRSVGLLR